MCTAEGGWGRTSQLKPAGLNPRQAMGMAAGCVAATETEEVGFLLGSQLDFAWLPARVSSLNWMGRDHKT